jgi:type IV secretion system protein TrbG
MMLKQIAPTLALWLLSTHVYAQSTADPYDAFSKKRARLSPAEEATTVDFLASNRPLSQPQSTPVVLPDRSVRLRFGAQYTEITCAVLQLCDVALQPGEQIQDIKVGDSDHWTLEPSVTAPGTAAAVEHVFIRPTDSGLETSAVILTDRRTYHFRLKSDVSRYMPAISFTYPSDARAQLEALKAKRTKRVAERARRVLPATGEDIANLQFAYDIDGEAPWKPVHVYNNGVKTVIEFPPSVRHTELPALLIVRADGGLLEDDDRVRVNSRFEDDPNSYPATNPRLVVDTVFDKAVLTAGVGGGRYEVTVTRRGGE